MKKEIVKQIGIDFGTSTTQVASIGENGFPDYYQIGNQSETMPTAIGFERGGGILYGSDAERDPGPDYIPISTDAGNSVKMALLKHGEGYEYNIFGEKKTAVEIARLLIQEALRRARVKGAAEGAIGTVCCPAEAPLSYRKAVRGCLDASGLATRSVIRNVVEEPALVANMARVQSGFEPGHSILIYDFGGGTFDTALVQIEEDKDKGRYINILCSEQRPVGGSNIDQAIYEHILKKAKITLEDAKPFMSSIRRQCRRAKEVLSIDKSVPITLPPIKNAPESVSLTREELNDIVLEFWLRTKECLDCLARRYKAITTSPDDPSRPRISDVTINTIINTTGQIGGGIDFVVPAGGTSQIPYIQEQLAAVFGASRIKKLAQVMPHLSVVGGAALCDDKSLPNNLSHIGWSTYVVFYTADHKPIPTPFLCERNGSINNPHLAREAYSPTATGISTVAGYYPQVSQKYIIPPMAKFARLLFLEGDMAPSDGDCVWPTLREGEEPCQADFYLLQYRTPQQKVGCKSPIQKHLDNLPALGTLEVVTKITGEIAFKVSPFIDGCGGQSQASLSDSIPAENVSWSVGNQLDMLLRLQGIRHERDKQGPNRVTNLMSDNEPG